MVGIFLGVATAGAGQGLDSLLSPGPLAGPHSELKGLGNCTSCHVPGKGVADQKCLDCHEDLATRIQAQRGFHRGKSECATCHADHQGEAFELVRWNVEEFDHSEAGYVLSGLHQKVQPCNKCHVAANAPARAMTTTYFLNDTRCVACHTDVHRAQLGEDCSQCHGMETPFADVQFDHSRTAFALVGAHRRVRCESCHTNQQWKGLRFSSCTSCHEDRHEPSLGSDCTTCHSQSAWTSYSMDHDRTQFALRGKHAEVQCGACHKNQVFQGLAHESCSDCHADDTHFGQFDDDCSSCHTVQGFEIVSIDHGATNYPLTGKHQDVACEKCHLVETEALFPAGVATAVRYTPLEQECRACHEDVHYGQLAEDCSRCHVTRGFRGEHLLFRHDTDAGFALRGKHGEAQCHQCHRIERGPFPEGSGLAVRYKPIADECITCHGNVHDEVWWRGSATALETDCADCHGLQTFELQHFDHGRTSFSLDGSHGRIDCNRCHDFAVVDNHRYLLFREIETQCIDCHASPHLRGMERCLDCHSTTTWKVGE